jgi:hypothetical protein
MLSRLSVRAPAPKTLTVEQRQLAHDYVCAFEEREAIPRIDYDHPETRIPHQKRIQEFEALRARLEKLQLNRATALEFASIIKYKVNKSATVKSFKKEIINRVRSLLTFMYKILATNGRSAA